MKIESNNAGRITTKARHHLGVGERKYVCELEARREREHERASIMEREERNGEHLWTIHEIHLKNYVTFDTTDLEKTN
jgi:hypothetical protein